METPIWGAQPKRVRRHCWAVATMGPRQRRSAYVESSRVSPPTGPYSVPSSNTGGLAAAARRGTLIPSRATRAQPVHMGSSSTVAAGTPRNRSRDGAPLCTLGWHRELRVWQGGDSTYEQFSCLTNCDFLPFGHRADTECNCSSLPQRLTCDRDRSGCSGELLWKAHNGRAGWGAPSPQGPLNPVLVAYVQGQATPVQDSSARTCWARSAGCSPPGRICHRSGDASGGTTGEEGRRPFRVATRTGAHRGADRVCREGGHGLNANLDCHATRCHTRFIVLAGAVSGCMLR